MFTELPRKKGEFLLEYARSLISAEEGERLTSQYTTENKGCFLYYFKFKNQQYWWLILIKFLDYRKYKIISFVFETITLHDEMSFFV